MNANSTTPALDCGHQSDETFQGENGTCCQACFEREALETTRAANRAQRIVLEDDEMFMELRAARRSRFGASSS